MRSSVTVSCEFFAVGAKPRCADERHPRRAEYPQQGDGHQGQRQRGAHLIDQGFGRGVAVAVLVFRQNRHEGLRKRAFGEQPPQQVGNLEGDEEGVGHHPRAECARDHRVADKPQDAREQGHAADRSEGFE